MNLKGWIAWVCLALIFVSLGLLIHANLALTAAQADDRDAHKQIDLLNAQIDQLKSSSVVTLSLDNARLRQENQSLSQKLAKANADLTALAAARNKLTQQLQSANSSLQDQQNRLQQMADYNQQMQAQAAPPPPPTPQYLSPDDGRDACINNLKAIDLAKQAWALENSKDATDTPTADDLLPYLKGNVMPSCPSGGTYTIGSMNQAPTCSVNGHVLP